MNRPEENISYSAMLNISELVPSTESVPIPFDSGISGIGSNSGIPSDSGQFRFDSIPGIPGNFHFRRRRFSPIPLSPK
jgi:hypothetical protein